MKRLVIRHAKTAGNRMNRALYGKQGASVSEDQKASAALLGERLRCQGIDTANEPVAVSELIRTQETAQLAGLSNLVVNSVLNEVNTADPAETQRNLEKGILPREAIEAAQNILANPPAERIWITHGLVIAGLCEVLHVTNEELIPGFCEITELSMPPPLCANG